MLEYGTLPRSHIKIEIVDNSSSFWECCQLRTLAHSLPGHHCKVRRTTLPEVILSLQEHPALMMAELLESEDFVEIRYWTLPLLKSASFLPMGTLPNLLLTDLCLRVYSLRPIWDIRHGHARETLKEIHAEVSRLLWMKERLCFVRGTMSYFLRKMDPELGLEEWITLL